MNAKISIAISCFQLATLGHIIYTELVKSRPVRKEFYAHAAQLKDEIARFVKHGPSMEQLQHMNAGMLAMMNGNRELFDHVVDDIEILHSLAYPNSESHPADCPVCISTLPALERLCEILATANVQFGPSEGE